MALTWGGRWRQIKAVTNMVHAKGGERCTALYFKIITQLCTESGDLQDSKGLRTHTMHDEVPTHTIMQHLGVLCTELGDGTGEADTGQKGPSCRL